jgi:hypothetical protein
MALIGRWRIARRPRISGAAGHADATDTDRSRSAANRARVTEGAAGPEGVARLAGVGVVTAARSAAGVTLRGKRLARAADTGGLLRDPQTMVIIAALHARFDHAVRIGAGAIATAQRDARWGWGGGPADRPGGKMTRALDGAGLAGPTTTTGRPTRPADLVAGLGSADPRLAGAGAAAAVGTALGSADALPLMADGPGRAGGLADPRLAGAGAAAAVGTALGSADALPA